ncbi:NYN domain-containing protein [Argonema antarcticum]|uniref:NYN domain-containing protein n=1 Tax=Argonema antarcticum TaxID=2942763 RepID=UPI0020111EAE|nr:NYN domain-containing protein [Argonema antarcticum]MCL1470305.1 NYN domain-containing protein [Argonema antarcticum A004/B2]
MSDINIGSDAQTTQQKVGIYGDIQNVPINPYLGRYLLIFAQLRGYIVCQKVYSFWRKENISIEQRLHELGYDCIDVPLITKNSVDEKLIADCKRDRSGLDIVILVTGDGDYADLVRQLKKEGKEVIIFAQSANASRNLIQLAEFYSVDQLPELNIDNVQPQISSIPSHISYNHAINYLIEAIKTAISEGKRTGFSLIGKLMRKVCSQYQGVKSIRTPDGKTFSKFTKFVEAAAKDGKVRINEQQLFLI